jgi:hypothetical protein
MTSMIGTLKTVPSAALELGARRLDGEGENWRVCADPAGKPFCLIGNT